VSGAGCRRARDPPIWSAFERGLPVIVLVLVHIGLIGAAG